VRDAVRLDATEVGLCKYFSARGRICSGNAAGDEDVGDRSAQSIGSNAHLLFAWDMKSFQHRISSPASDVVRIPCRQRRQVSVVYGRLREEHTGEAGVDEEQVLTFGQRVAELATLHPEKAAL